MSPRVLWISIIAVLVSFAGGFLLANAFNRAEIEELKAENNRLSKPASESTESALSKEEIRSSIARADAEPANFSLQRNLGTALYRYGSVNRDLDLLAEAARILERALTLKPEDRDLIVTVGNAHFDAGYFGKRNGELEIARNYYGRALKLKPDDADVRADVGLTYFLFDPPELEQAVTEFKQALASDPKHEKSLQFLIQTLARKGKTDEAKQYLVKLKEYNPTSEAISGLASMIEDPTASQQ